MNINKIISKFILGKADQEELHTLDDWKKDTEENVKALEDLVKINALSNALADYKDVDTDLAWKKITQKTSAKPTAFSIKKWSYAAAVLVIILASFLVMTHYSGRATFEEKQYAGSAIRNVALQDGSKITLDTDGILAEKAYRKITLDGRAFFEITPDPKSPFTIALHHGSITVLGTKFNVITRDSFSQIYVQEGKVLYSYLDKSYTLVAGDIVTVEAGQIRKISGPTVKPDAWILQQLSFENKSLHFVLENIAVFYNVKLQYLNALQDDTCKINTNFRNETLENVLKELELLSGLKYELHFRKIIVKSFKC